MFDKIVIWLIKALIKIWDRYDDQLAFSFGVDEHKAYSVLVERYYDDHWEYGTKSYSYAGKET